MKKKLLFGTLLMGALIANAQTEISFEASEGYVTGEIHGQNGWVSTEIIGAGGVVFNATNQNITNEAATDGAMSFKLDRMPQLAGGQPLMGAMKRVSLDDSTMNISFDVYLDQQSPDTSDFAISFFGNGVLVQRLQFQFNGDISVVAAGNGDPAFIFEPVAAWAARQWYTVDITADFEAQTATYTINGESAGTHDLLGDQLELVIFGLDNFGGFAYVDNISYEGIAAGTNEVLASHLAIFPNPANDIVNISGMENIVVEKVTITDNNGRVVKTVHFGSIANTAINISELAPGTYFVTIVTDKGNAEKKIIKN